MNDFNAILGKVKNWANAAGKKAEEVAETSKLKMQILSVILDRSESLLGYLGECLAGSVGKVGVCLSLASADPTAYLVQL